MVPNEDYLSAFKADKLNRTVTKARELHFKIFLQVTTFVVSRDRKCKGKNTSNHSMAAS